MRKKGLCCVLTTVGFAAVLGGVMGGFHVSKASDQGVTTEQVTETVVPVLEE